MCSYRCMSKKGSQRSTEAKPEEEYTIHVFDLCLLGSSLVLRSCLSQPCARTSSAKALRGLQGHAAMWTRQTCGEMTALQALAGELQRWVGYPRVPNAMPWVQGSSSSLVAHRLGMCGKPHCGVLASGSVPSEGLMLYITWRK